MSFYFFNFLLANFVTVEGDRKRPIEILYLEEISVSCDNYSYDQEDTLVTNVF